MHRLPVAFQHKAKTDLTDLQVPEEDHHRLVNVI